MTVDAAPRGWRGDVGIVSTLVDRLPFSAAGATAYVCGPEVMMRVVARRLVDAGTEASRVSVSLERNMHCARPIAADTASSGRCSSARGPVVAVGRVAEPLLGGERR